MEKNISVVILLHENTKTIFLKRYSIHFMVEYWRDQGISVDYLFGTNSFKKADICIVHVDLSVVPDVYLSFARQYPVVINGDVRDIRKSQFSEHRLTRASYYEGPVIVKSNLNCAGWPEKLVSSNLVSLIAQKLHGRVIPSSNIVSQLDYRIYDSLNNVPEQVFENSELHVEQFLPEQDGELYCVNFYKFFGESEQCTKIWAKDPIVTGKKFVKRKSVDPHPEIRKWRNQLNIDYGKIDYCINGGKPVLLDVNKTPSTGQSRPNSELVESTRQRAEGLFGFIQG